MFAGLIAFEKASEGWSPTYALLRLRKTARGVTPTSGRKREAGGAGRLVSPFRPVPMEALGKLKQFDAYPKTLEDFRVKTCGGATGRSWRGQGCKEGAVLAFGPGSRTLPGLLGAEGWDAGHAKSRSRSAVTIVSGLLMLLLFLSELQYYLTTEVRGVAWNVGGA